MKNKTWFWGLFFVCAGAIIILNALNVWGEIGVFRLLLGILMVPVIIKSIPGLHFGGILFPLAFLIILFAEELNLTMITPWPVLFTALFLTIGLSLVFKGRQYGFHNFGRSRKHRKHGYINTTGSIDEDEVSFGTSFGAGSKYLNSSNLRKAEFHCSFGALQIYFDNAQLSPEGATAHFEGSFCGIEIYIPRTWQVQNNIEVSLGSVEENNKGAVSEGPVLTLTGSVSLGGMEINYI